MKFDELCNELMVENMNQKGIEKEDVEYFLYFKETQNKLGDVQQIGDPEWGKWTQEQHDKWRKDAERYAQEWSLEFRDRSGNRISVEEADDSYLRRDILQSLEEREDSFFWELFEKLGLKNPSDELQQKIYQGMDTLTYYIKNNPREFDGELDELNKEIFEK